MRCRVPDPNDGAEGHVCERWLVDLHQSARGAHIVDKPSSRATFVTLWKAATIEFRLSDDRSGRRLTKSCMYSLNPSLPTLHASLRPNQRSAPQSLFCKLQSVALIVPMADRHPAASRGPFARH